MDSELRNALESYNLLPAVECILELERTILQGSNMMQEMERELLRKLIGGVRWLIDGRNEGYRNDVRHLQEIKFFGAAEADDALRLYDTKEPARDPAKDLQSLSGLAKVAADQIPKFKENRCC